MKNLTIQFNEVGSAGELIIDGKKIKMHGTYSPYTYYFDFGELPESMRNQIIENGLTVDDSAYTVHVPTAFLRESFESVDGESLEFELHLGNVQFDDDFDSDGESLLDDPDSTYQDRAGELLACSDSLEFQSIYLKVY